jgi:methyl-accepting chemotaxis protein
VTPASYPWHPGNLRSAAAKQIKSLIQNSVNKVTEGARLVDETGEVLSDIVTRVKKVTDVVADIAVSSGERAAGIDQVNTAVTSMDRTTQQDTALVEQSSAAAQALTEQAASLSELMARFWVQGVAAKQSSPVMKTAAGAGSPRRRAG